MSDANIRILYEFFTDGKMISFTSESGNMRAENLGYGSPAMVWRSAYEVPPNPIPDQEFIYDLGVSKPINCVFLYNTNISYGGVFKLTIATDALFANIIFYKEWAIRTPLYGYGEGPYGLIPYGGYSEEEINLNYFVKYLENIYIGQYVKKVISDPLNPAGFLEVGRSGVGQYWEPEYNVAWGEPLSLQTETKSVTMRSGAISVQKFPQARNLSATFNFLDETEAYKMVSINYKVGHNKDIFISLYPDKSTNFGELYSMLAKITDFSGISKNNPMFSSGSWVLHESL